jgi:hypothetical protein
VQLIKVPLLTEVPGEGEQQHDEEADGKGIVEPDRISSIHADLRRRQVR